MLKKKAQHSQTGFAVTYREIDESNIFKEILPGYKIAHKFDGSFHEFEVDKQGSIIARWLRAHRYMPCKMGPFTI
jgi:transposase-like protein